MSAAPMMIGQLARATATKVTTIRFYETIGLLSAQPRTESGRRTYGSTYVQRLHFIRNGRRLGFSIDEIRSLIGLAENPDQDCGAASAIAARHLEDMETRLVQLTSLRDELATLARSCTSAQIADCRVIQAIASCARDAHPPRSGYRGTADSTTDPAMCLERRLKAEAAAATISAERTTP